MAADLSFTIDEASLEGVTPDSLRDSYRRLLRGKVCRVHGRGVRVTIQDDTADVNLSGCCDAFVREARGALR